MTARVVTDPSELHELYSRDAHLHLYALIDLEEPYWSASTWWRNGDAALGLVGLPDGATVVYAVSSADPSGTLALAAELSPQIPPGLVTGVTGIAEVLRSIGRPIAWQRGYHRYHLTDRNRVPSVDESVVALGPSNVDDALALYALAPGAAFFTPAMLSDDTFVGVRHDGELVAIAGTHGISDTKRVAAIGAVFTHPLHRGRGLGTLTTAGVINRIGDRAGTIGLNCTDANTRAIRIYEAMGFEPKLAYEECELA